MAEFPHSPRIRMYVHQEVKPKKKAVIRDGLDTDT